MAYPSPKRLLLIALTLALAACNAEQRPDWFNNMLPDNKARAPAQAAAQNVADAACPPVVLIPEFRAVHEFRNELSPRESNAISAAVITNVTASCHRTAKTIAVSLDVSYRAVLGPQARAWTTTDHTNFAYPLFIALGQPGGRYASQELFSASASFPRNKYVTDAHEQLHQVIPLGLAANSQLYVGFQLTEAQLAYNRSLAGLQNQPVSAAPPIAIIAPKVQPLKKPVKRKPVKKSASP